MVTNKATLLIDLDDTLIESGILYIETKFVIAKKITSLLPDSATTIEEIILEFDETEQKNIDNGHNWGVDNFRVSLMEASFKILGYTFFSQFLYKTIDHEIEILRRKPRKLNKGVLDTIIKLKKKGYQLILVTKGNLQDQSEIVNSLNIEILFDSVEIIPQKQASNYRGIILKHNLNEKLTFMIGNNPKHDINPAKEAGIKTVLIPSPGTFRFDIQKVNNCIQKTIILQNFEELLQLDFYSNAWEK